MAGKPGPPKSSAQSTPKAAIGITPAKVSQVSAERASSNKKKRALAAAKGARSDGDHILGDVDYVKLMYGTRKEAQQEAGKSAS